MKKFNRYIIAAAMAALLSLDAAALDLPVKNINGKDYYYYAVKRGDTLLSIAGKLGVTRDDIVRYNQSAADVLRQGTTIYLPVDEFADVISPAATRNAAPAATGAYFDYKVERGETLFGISHRFGVTPDAIVQLNPGAVQGIKAGQILRIPGTNPEGESAPVEAPAAEPSLQINEDQPRNLRPVPGPQLVEVNEPQEEAVEAIDTTPANVAIFLPLMLKGDSQARQARQAAEFTKGFMLGLESMKGVAWPTNVKIFDTNARPDTIATLLNKPECDDLQLIITPDDLAAVQATVNALGNRNTFMLNLMAVQDTSYLVDHRVMQFNVPHNIMYAKAAEALLMAYDGYTPVFLISKGGRSEKLPFTDFLREQYAEQGIEPIDMTFEGMLTSADLETLDPAGRYVFIPSSGSLTEFNKFARPIINLREQSGNPEAYTVFGYPDWTAFVGDPRELLHRMEATIYSRFYADSSAPAVADFAADFKARYGTEMIEQVPSMAMLGYDTARYMISNIKANDGTFDAEWSVPYRGLQSSFMFVDAESPLPVDGVANGAVYIINFLPDNEVSVQVL